MAQNTSKAHNTKVNREHQEVNLVELIEEFGSEDKCREYLEALRWPDGVECPRCQSRKLSRIKKRNQYECSGCRYQFSVKSGTVFGDSHLPLWKWFLAVYLIGESKKGMSANQLKRTLGVTYKTSWYLCHRIRFAMSDPAAELLGGTVEVDETYIGGRSKGGPRDNKTMVLGAVERGGSVRLKVEKRPHASHKMLKQFIDETVADDAEALYTDAHPGYRGIMDDIGVKHETVNHSVEEWVRADVHTNSIEGVWSLFNRAVVGSFHQLSVKHLPAYLDEFAFRFNNRDNPYLFRDTILRLIDSDMLRYDELVAGQAESSA